jgi:hypothetical protein
MRFTPVRPSGHATIHRHKTSLIREQGLATSGLCNHWTNKPEWYSGRRLWAFYLTFGKQPALQARVQHDQQALGQIKGLDMIKPGNLHLSIQGTAFTDQVDTAQVERLVAHVQDALVGHALPILSASRVVVDHDAICMPVFPIEELAGIKKLVRGAAEEIFGADRIYTLPESPGGFSPHISIAYSNADLTAEDIAFGMAGVDDGLISMNVSHLSLVALRRDVRSWSWDDERQLSFNPG